MKRDHVGMPDVRQHIALRDRITQQVSTHNLVFSKNLHSILQLCLLVLHQENLTERTFAKPLYQKEGIWSH